MIGVIHQARMEKIFQKIETILKFAIIFKKSLNIFTPSLDFAVLA